MPLLFPHCDPRCSEVEVAEHATEYFRRCIACLVFNDVKEQPSQQRSRYVDLFFYRGKSLVQFRTLGYRRSRAHENRIRVKLYW